MPWPMFLVVWLVKLPLIILGFIFYIATMDQILHFVQTYVKTDEGAHWSSRLVWDVVASIVTLAIQTVLLAGTAFVVGNFVMSELTPAYFKRRHWWNAKV